MYVSKNSLILKTLHINSCVTSSFYRSVQCDHPTFTILNSFKPRGVQGFSTDLHADLVDFNPIQIGTPICKIQGIASSF